MFKKITILLILALLVTTAGARSRGLVYHTIEIVDELGRPVTDITNLYIYQVGGTTNAVIYNDAALQNVITIPMTEVSPNTTLVDGRAHWWGADGWDFSVSNDGAVGPMTNANHEDRTASDGRLIFPSYFSSMATTAWLDAQSISMGTGAEWVINGGGVADTLSFIPTADNSNFILGVNGAAANVDLTLYVDTDLGLYVSSTGPSLIWNGGDCSLNPDVAGTMNINTGTATGAINIGCATAGIITVDTTESIGINADIGITVTNTTAANDQIYTTAGNFQIIAQEAGSLTAVNIDITGAVSGFDLDTTNGPIVMTAADAGNGDITLVAADVMTFTSVDTKIFDGAANELWVIDGTAAGFTHTLDFTDATGNIVWTFPDIGTGAGDDLAFVPTTWITNYPEIADAVWMAQNQIRFEGAAADAFESVITSADITGGVVTWTLPDLGGIDTLAFMGSTLATNAPDIADSVTGGTNQLIFEGNTADASEIILTAEEPTAAVLYTLPDAAAATYGLVTSTLAANGVDIVNAVWGGTNQMIFEGATANGFETALQPENPTQTNVLTLPDDTGTLLYHADAGTTAYGPAGAIPLTDAVVLWTSTGADAATLADGFGGQIITIIMIAQAGGADTLTPASITGAGYASIAFTAVGESVTLMFIDATIGWVCIGTAGVTTQPLLVL